MTPVLDPVLYALSHAAFGTVAVMAMGYVAVLAGKLEDRHLEAETSNQPDIIRRIKASGGAAIIPHYVYVYGHKDAEDLSAQLRLMQRRMTWAYLACVSMAFLIHSPELWDFVGVEDIRLLINLISLINHGATVFGLPEPLVWPIGFTAVVVVEMWRATRKYLKLLSQGRVVANVCA